MRLTWLGHSTVLLEVSGVRLLTDPLLGRHAGLLRRVGPAPSPASWGDVDAVLLSHLHHDHAELSSLRCMGDVRVIALPAVAAWLARRSVGRPVPLAVGSSYAVTPSVSVVAAPAEHRHRPMPHRPSDACGHLVDAPDAVVWVCGDTELFGGLSSVPSLSARGRVDVALVPVGGWGPRLSRGHLDPVQAARACAVVGASVAVPVHWGTLHAPLSRGAWFDAPGPAFAAALAQEAPGCEAVVLRPGETASV